MYSPPRSLIGSSTAFGAFAPFDRALGERVVEMAGRKIADDIEDNRQLLAQLLAPVGFEIRLATNGAEAVQEFKAPVPENLRAPGASRRPRTVPRSPGSCTTTNGSATAPPPATACR